MTESRELSEATITYAGKSFRFAHSDPSDHIFRTIKNSNTFYEGELLGVIADLLKPGDLVVDAGANIGNHTVFFAGVCECRVLSFEPDPVASSLLRRNVLANRLGDRVEIHQGGLGAETGRASLRAPQEHNLGTTGLIVDGKGRCEVRPLDDFADAGKFRIIKIDVEGMDLDVLRGAQAVIKRDGPIIAIEARDRQTFAGIVALLGPHGYGVVGSYSYTPTHIFAKGAVLRSRVALPQLSMRQSIDYVDHAVWRDKLARQIIELREKTDKTTGLQAANLSRYDEALSDIAQSFEAIKSRMDGGNAVATRAEERQERLVEDLTALRNELQPLHEMQRNLTKFVADLQLQFGKAAHFVSRETAGLRAEFEQTSADLIDTFAEKFDQMRHLVTSQVARVQEELERRSQEHGERLSDLSGQHSREFQRLRTAAEAAVEAALLAGAAQEADSAALRAELRSLIRHDLEASLREMVAATLSELRRELSFAVGAEFAELQIAMEKPLAVSTATGNGGPVESWDRTLDRLAVLDSEAASPQPVQSSGVTDRNSLWYVRKPHDHEQAPAARQMAQQQNDTLLVADDDFSKGWHQRGWAQEDTDLESEGIVRAKARSKQIGFATREFDFKNGGLLEVELHSKRTGNGRHLLRIVDEYGGGIGHDFVLESDIATFRAFAPADTTRIKLYVLSLDVDPGECFRVGRFVLRRLDAAAHQSSVRAKVAQQVLASMASIPSRRDMLADCVRSLLVQCDRVRVFLNDYPDVPDFLVHPRVEVRRSQEWDDRGDAGKMFWLERDREPGYRLIVDDDLIFPPDFAEVMCGKVAATGNKAIFAAHGILLRQPIKNYYDNCSRAVTFHFGRELLVDRSVHIGATNALCVHSGALSMRWADFKYSNSADIWLALYAQQKRLPVLTPARPRNWIRENLRVAPEETIYLHSLNRTRSRFDSSLVQDAVLKRSWPITVRTGDKPKYGLLVRVGNTERLAERIEQVLALAGNTAEWVVMLSFDRTASAMDQAISSVSIDRETHLIDTTSDPAGLFQARALMSQIGLDAIVGVEECALSVSNGAQPPDVGPLEPWNDASVTLLRTKADNVVAGVVLTDKQAVPDGLLRVIEGLVVTSPGSETFAQALRKCPAPPRMSSGTFSQPTINSTFQCVKVLNLDRRPDRWKSVSESLALAGIKAERFSAVDGNLPEIASGYERYLKQPKVVVSEEIPPVRTPRDLYVDFASQMARLAYLERDGRKAIASRGAWGYLKSYEAILEDALTNGTDSLLVFDDDVLLHKDIRALFASTVRQLPDNWLILQLGTLQYNWAPPWCEWYSPMLYRTNGSAIGSHAVGMRFDVLPYLLDHVRRYDMPFDIGALSAATSAFPERCFVVYPNLAIQSLADTDIKASEFQKVKDRERALLTYKWNLDDYQ